MRVVVEGQRVLLRPFLDEDVGAFEAWYGEAVEVAGIPHLLPLSHFAGERRSDIGERGGALVIAQVGEREPIGLVEYRVGEPAEGWLTVGFIALAKAYRGWGYGSEAVRFVEDEAVRSWGVRRFRAEVDMRNGLGLYFWLRLGYRPVGRDERAAWHLEASRDSMAMVREADP